MVPKIGVAQNLEPQKTTCGKEPRETGGSGIQHFRGLKKNHAEPT